MDRNCSSHSGNPKREGETGRDGGPRLSFNGMSLLTRRLVPRPHLFKILPCPDSARLEESLLHMGLWKHLRSRLSQKWNNESAFLHEMVAPWGGGTCF